MNKTEINNMSSLALAHLGDAVYELIVRERLCASGLTLAKTLHKRTVEQVSATAQARRAREILELLTDEEREVFMRARNTHVKAYPKGASVADYHLATAFEALLGYLYLSEKKERIKALCDTSPLVKPE